MRRPIHLGSNRGNQGHHQNDLALSVEPLRRAGLQAAKRISNMNSHRSLIGNFAQVGAILPGKSKSRTSRQPTRHVRRKSTRARPKRRPAPGTLAQKRNLVLAALRVWELKQGARG